MLKILPFRNTHQNEIDLMMKEIASEFELPISSQSALKTAALIDKYWVALYNDKIVGTIGLLNLKNNCSELKRLFVKSDFRGKEFSVSKELLQNVLRWSITNGSSTIYLGTMDQFKAAHKFYKKNMFVKIFKEELPLDFIINPVDSIFYKIDL